MAQTNRIFIPGSEWIFFKIYAGYKTLDKIVSKNMPLIINKLYRDKMIVKWFFIRYNDPDSHLRIRFLVGNTANITNVIKLIYDEFKYLTRHNYIWKIQLDTYNRELDRYGNKFIDSSESIFHIDSDCILSTVKIINLYKDETYRWKIALKVVDSLLTDFSYSIERKLHLISGLSDSFKKEFGFNKYNSKQFNTIFRENKKAIELVMNDTISDHIYTRLSNSLSIRSSKIKPLIEKTLINMEKAGQNITMDSLLISYIHMSLNRLFISNNRVHELVIYDFLKRYYTSEIIKLKYNNSI